MKINYLLLLKIVALEILCSVSLFFVSFFALWGYFGEGAGAESHTAILYGKVATSIVLFPPIIFNIYKMFAPNEKQNSFTYFGAQIVIILLFFCASYIGFIDI